MKANLIKTTVIVLFFAASTYSCEWLLKEDMYSPDCKSGNCVSVNIKGAVYVKPSKEGLNNIPVRVYFYENARYGWFTEPRGVVSGKTNRNGEFNFKVTINPADFDKYRLYVKIPVQKDYLAFAEDSKCFYDFDADALQNINFEYYNKAPLTINLKRTQTDVFDRFDVRAVFIDGNNQYLIHYYLYSTVNQNANDTIRQIETVADFYTKIVWWKQHDGKMIKEIDSLICLPNKDNIFNINY